MRRVQLIAAHAVTVNRGPARLQPGRRTLQYPLEFAKFRESGNGGPTVPARCRHLRGAGPEQGPGYFQAPARQLTPSAGAERGVPAELKDTFQDSRPPRDREKPVVDLCPSLLASGVHAAP